MWAWFLGRTGAGAGSSATDEEQAETPELYLKLAKRCMKEVDSVLSSGASTSPKFNYEQCKYLADKLRVVVPSAHCFFESANTRFASKEDRAQSLDIFKHLFAWAKEVESFIQGCCKDAWLQPAFWLTSMPEGISSLGFELEFCRKVFSIRTGFAEPLTSVEVSKLRTAEVEIVAVKANIDKLSLYRELDGFIRSSKASTVEVQLAIFLLERLKSALMGSGTNLPGCSGLSHPDINISSLKQVKFLGEGAFGTVHEVNWLGTGVARKTFHGPRFSDFEQEISVLEGLHHPNIVSLLWYTRDERKCYMIMELMDRDLYSLMQERLEECKHVHPPFSISEAVHVMLQMAEGILFLHEKRIAHRDLKSRNILVKLPKASEVGVTNLHVKVADYGLSKTKEKSQTYSQQTQNLGTTRWMAPEMMKIANGGGGLKTPQQEVELQYPFKVDVYSYAIVCYEILTGELPFSELSPKEVKAKVLGGGRPQLPDQCPQRLKHLIELCWSTKPSMRPSFGGICAELREWKCTQLITCAVSALRLFTVEETKETTNNNNRENRLSVLPEVYKDTMVDTAVPGLRPGLRFFTWEEVLKITNNYSDHNRIRILSEVYEGVMVDTGEVVAVNRGLDDVPMSDCNVKMGVLSRLHHYNVVRCMGLCIEGGEVTLVCEYTTNGALEDWLFDNERKVHMTWPVRRNICLGVAKGIHQLHSAQPRMIHCDINPTNILLDKNLEPKVLYPGFAVLAVIPHDEISIQRIFVHSYGMELYAPEFSEHGRISEKFDVYSFGVLLFEIVCGRRRYDFEVPMEDLRLVNWARKLYKRGRMMELVDSNLSLEMNEVNETRRFLDVAFLCTNYREEKRPTMTSVVVMLQGHEIEPF